MPLYEYICKECGEHWEVLCPWAEAKQEFPCQCGGKLHKIISVPGKAQWNCECPTASQGK